MTTDVGQAAVHLRWVDELPPQVDGPPVNHALVAAALRTRPGEWAMLPDLIVQYGHAIRSGRLAAYRPGGSFEAEVRNHVVYVRYVGQEAYR